MSDRSKAAELEEAGIETIVYEVLRDDPGTLPDVDVLFLEIWDPDRSDLYWEINFHGVGRVVERYAGSAAIVNGSTLNVYGEGPSPLVEEAGCSPTTEYARSRYAQERLIDYFCRSRGSKAIHVRYAHANDAENGRIRKMAVAIAAGRSLGSTPDERIQVIAYEDFIRVTAQAVEHAANPPAVVNCCHPRVWTIRELAETIHARLGRGRVAFDRETGGKEASVYGDCSKMVELFGAPGIGLDELIGRVVEAMNA